MGQGLPSERELAEKFKVSRAVIREALKSLEQSGFVEIRIGSSGGAFVAGNLHLPLFFSIYDLLKGGELTLDHFYEVRRMVECASVRLACTKATAKDIERLRILNRKILDDLNDPSKPKGGNRAFHLAIAEISGNPLSRLIVHSLLLLIDNMLPTLTQYRGFVRKMCERHEAIIQAMETRDVTLCELLMATDTEFTKKLKPWKEAVLIRSRTKAMSGRDKARKRKHVNLIKKGVFQHEI